MPLKLPSPAYWAVMTLVVPRGSSVVEALVATPLDSVFVLNATPLVRKITLPLGVVTPLTVLLNVTLSAKPDGLSEEATTEVEDTLVILAVTPEGCAVSE